MSPHSHNSTCPKSKYILFLLWWMAPASIHASKPEIKSHSSRRDSSTVHLPHLTYHESLSLSKYLPTLHSQRSFLGFCNNLTPGIYFISPVLCNPSRYCSHSDFLRTIYLLLRWKPCMASTPLTVQVDSMEDDMHYPHLWPGTYMCSVSSPLLLYTSHSVLKFFPSVLVPLYSTFIHSWNPFLLPTLLCFIFTPPWGFCLIEALPD